MSLENKYFAELARRLRAAGITAGHPEKNRLTVLLNNQPVLSVSAGSDVFLLPAGSNQPEAGELYHKVAQTADEVYAYQNLTPVSGFSIQAVQAQYTIDTKQISLCITNHSDNSPELYLPYLEQNINETWVIVKKSPYIRDTDNLLYIPSGETMSVDFFLTDYDQLSVGKYRIIFGLAHSNDFFYFPFDIVDS